jgi:hypothetical protein
MDYFKKFLKKAFRQKYSQYVYITYINNSTGTEISGKYVCFEYFQGESAERIKERIISLLKIEEIEAESITHYALRILRFRNIFEYDPKIQPPFEKYDTIILECE